MNLEEINDEMRYLNQVSITSDIRAPGEYKYYYCGEHNDSSDKSFLKLSTMWYNGKINEDMILLSSSYNSTHTCQLYLNINKYIYEIFIYQNYIDFTSENINMKIIKHMRLNHSLTDLNIKEELSKSEEGSMELGEKIKVKIFFDLNN